MARKANPAINGGRPPERSYHRLASGATITMGRVVGIGASPARNERRRGSNPGLVTALLAG